MLKMIFRSLLSSLVLAALILTLAQSDKIAPRMVVKPIDPLPIGAPIDVEVGLFGNNDRPLANNVIEIYLDGEYIRRSRTDENGTANIRVSRDLPLGNYEITVRFVGTRDYLETQVLLPITIRPIYLTIQTVPVVPGVNFKLGDQELSTDTQGLVRFEITVPGIYNLEALLEPYTVVTPDTRATFARWEDEVFTSQRIVEMTNSDLHMQIGFALSHPIQTHFVDLTGEAIDWSRISSITLKSSSAAYRTIDSDQPYWLQTNRILRQRTGIFPTEILWSVESVLLDGSNVVNRYQQRYYVKPNDNWQVQLLVYQARISSKDALFGVPVGTGVTLTYPDGSTIEHSFDENGQLSIFDMARGQYKMKVEGASGVAPITPVALTKDQEVELKVFSGLDIGAMVALGLFLGLGLLFYGRPHLMMLRRQPRLITGKSSHTKPLAALTQPMQTILSINKILALDESYSSVLSNGTFQSLESNQLFAVELLEAVLSSHLKAIAPPIAKRLKMKTENVIELLSVQPAIITRPISPEKAIALSGHLNSYAVKTRVVKLDHFLPPSMTTRAFSERNFYSDDEMQEDSQLQNFLTRTLNLPKEG
jgi:hypothetical protein